MIARARTTLCDRAPLCDAALATNRELQARVNELEQRLLGREHRTAGSRSLRLRLTAAERELRQRDEGPWAFLPWRGYAS